MTHTATALATSHHASLASSGLGWLAIAFLALVILILLAIIAAKIGPWLSGFAAAGLFLLGMSQEPAFHAVKTSVRAGAAAAVGGAVLLACLLVRRRFERRQAVAAQSRRSVSYMPWRQV